MMSSALQEPHLSRAGLDAKPSRAGADVPAQVIALVTRGRDREVGVDAAAAGLDVDVARLGRGNANRHAAGAGFGRKIVEDGIELEIDATAARVDARRARLDVTDAQPA